MNKIKESKMLEAIQENQLKDVAYASVHFSDGSSYAIVKEELSQAHDNLHSLSGFCFLAINWMDGELKIIRKK